MPGKGVRVIVGIVIILVFALVGLGIDYTRGDGFMGLLLFPGVILGGAYVRSLRWAFVSAFIATLIVIIPFQIALNPGMLEALSNPNILAVLIFFSLIYTGISAVAGLVTGFFAARRAKKRGPT